MTQNSQETVIGRITSVFGVKGWLKVFSYTDPKDGILNYRDWTLLLDGKRIPIRLEEGRRQGQGIVVRLKGIDDREVARTYCGAEIRVPTEQLPELPEGEFYWHQLEGLDVFTVEGECWVRCITFWRQAPMMSWWCTLRRALLTSASV